MHAIFRFLLLSEGNAIPQKERNCFLLLRNAISLEEQLLVSLEVFVQPVFTEIVRIGLFTKRCFSTMVYDAEPSPSGP